MNLTRTAVLSLAFCVALTGCTTMRGAPRNVLDEGESALMVKVDENLVTRVIDRELDEDGNPTTERVTERVERVEAFRSLTTRQEILNYYLTQVSDGDRRGFRNRVIDHYMGEIDRNYEHHTQRLFTEGVQVALGFDTAIIGLSATAALFEEVADDLATVITGFAGVQAAIDKNLYFDRTLPALITTMDAERTKVETQILQRKELETADYSLEGAIRDLRRYQQAGTLMRAVTKVTETASAAKEDAEDAYERELGIACTLDDSLSEQDQVRISDAFYDNYNAAVDNGDLDAERRVRGIALAFGVSAQGNIEEVGRRVADAWSTKFCTQDEVETLKTKLSPFLGS